MFGDCGISLEIICWRGKKIRTASTSYINGLCYIASFSIALHCTTYNDRPCSSKKLDIHCLRRDKDL